jgi:hypothetical protein
MIDQLSFAQNGLSHISLNYLKFHSGSKADGLKFQIVHLSKKPYFKLKPFL